jgi:hypothetical protein
LGANFIGGYIVPRKLRLSASFSLKLENLLYLVIPFEGGSWAAARLLLPEIPKFEEIL